MNELEKAMRAWVFASIELAAVSRELITHGKLKEERDRVDPEVISGILAITAGIVQAAAADSGRMVAAES